MVRSFTRLRNRLPGRPHFFRVGYTTGAVIHGYMLLAKRHCPSITDRDSFATL